eukprot:TRINITY_DN3477_c0_g2_i1.p1 TRINITY_DN3477_c0_g2~~TRINITY_DN3477_c0_g2_i1.p1  ORF type:complete len:697 (+),score=181.93 TRINITY_DN3477_c0_g2_i1:167-2257(+)
MNRSEDFDLASSASLDESDSHSSHESSGIEDKNLGEVVQKLLEDIPLRFFVVQWLDPSDECGWYIVGGNEPDPYSTSMPLKDMIGKRVDEVYPGTKGDLTFFGLYKKVVTTGVPVEYELNYKDDKVVTKSRIKQTALPNNCVMVVYENLLQVEELKAKREKQNEKMEALLEKAIDIMIHAKPTDAEDLSMVTLKGLLNANSTTKESGNKVLVEEFERNQKVISVADVETLVGNLSLESQDNAFSRQFLTSFRYFMSPSVLLKKLMVAFMTAQKQTQRDWTDEEREASKGKTGVSNIEVNAVKGTENPEEKVIDTFKIWLAEHFYDFDNDPELLKSLQEFINNSLLSSERTTPYGKALNKLIEKNLRSEMAAKPLTDSSDYVPKTLRSKVNILEENPVDVAHQMTLICFETFKAVKPMEFYEQSWSKENASILSPNILDMIKNFNNITNWVSTEICLQLLMKDRVMVLRHFIEIAWAAFGYRDFETTFAVMLGLGSLTISRLTETWRALDGTTKQKYLKMHEFTSYKYNFRNYRKKFQQIISSPLGANVIPYFSLYLKDLTAMEEKGNFSQVAAGAVNFHKMRKVASAIGEVQKAQKSIFAFSKNVKLLVFLTRELPHVSEDAQWVLTKKCEADSSGQDPADICASAPASPGDILRAVTRRASGDIAVQTSNPIFGVTIPKGSLKSPSPIRRVSSKN